MEFGHADNETAGCALVSTLSETRETRFYRGVRTADHRPVLLKAPRYDGPDSGAVAAIRREYHILLHLKGIGGVCRVLEMGYHRNLPVLILEDPGGGVLADSAHPGLGLDRILGFGAQVAGILDEIHGRGIVHGDLCPANLLVNPAEDAVFLFNFGSAVCPESVFPVGKTRRAKAHPAYLSPEATGRMDCVPDGRSDYYSLGVILYELLTGHRPFKAVDPTELFYAHIARQPISPLQPSVGFKGTSVPSAVSDLVLKLMAKSPEDRYRTGAGIRADLEACRRLLRETGEIPAFVLGRRDGFEDLLLPDKLYGRDAAANRLRRFLEEGREGGRRLVLVSGDPGIGKTALVRSVMQTVQGEGMRFLTGKFRPIRENIPYSGIAACISDLVRQISAEGKTGMWQKRISDALGAHVRVITDLAPEAVRITGPAPELPELGPLETRNRSELAFTHFFQLFQSADAPLALFLDDLQWADEASIRLTAALLTLDEAGFLTVIGAYRDKEVHAGDSFSGALGFLENKEIPVRHIRLMPLHHEDAARLIQDGLNLDTASADALARRLIGKTFGNPYFIRQLLKRMHRDGSLHFDQDQGGWQWRRQEDDLGHSDTVFSLLRSEMAAQPESHQRVLYTAACIGDSVEGTVLTAACGVDYENISVILDRLIGKGYLQKISDSGVRFSDDQMQQAAFSLIPERRLADIQRRIGRSLLRSLSPEELERNFFDIVLLLNQGIEPGSDGSDRHRVAGMNLLAGRKAKTSAAYKAAFDYFSSGIRMLGDHGRETAFDLSLALYLEAAESAYLVGRFDTAEELVQAVLQHGPPMPERIRAVQVRLLSLMARNRTDEAVEAVLADCRECGIRLPESPGLVGFFAELMKIRWMLKGRSPEAVLEMPEMTDPDLLAVMRLLATGVSIFYLTRPTFMPFLMFRMVTLSLRHGVAPESPFAYAIYGLILCGVCRRVERGYRFGRMALRLAERSGYSVIQAKTGMLYYGFIHFWKHPLRETLPPLQETFRTGMDCGDLEYASWTLHIHSYHAYFSGLELTALEKEMAADEAALLRNGQQGASVAQAIYRQAVLNLLGSSPDPCRLTGDAYDEARMLPQHHATENTHAVFNVHFHQLILCCLFGRYQESLDHAERAEACLESVSGLIAVYIFYFYRALAGYALADSASGKARLRQVNQAAAWQRKLKVWTRHAPMNFQHKFDLLTAERHRARGRYDKAAEYFVRAVTGARENGYYQDEALGAERAGRFYLDRGMEVPGRSCLLIARMAYRRWGAQAKVSALTEEWRDLFAGLGSEIEAALPPPTPRDDGASEMAAVMAAARTLSGEMHLETLLKMIMDIVMKHSGARRGCLLIHQKGSLTLEAEAGIEPEYLHVLEGTPLDEVRSAGRAIVREVARTRSSLILRDASRDDRYENDPDVRRHRSRSVLCIPLIHKDELAGVLYLENELAAGVFTAERVDMMRLLSSQAAVFIQNALLYRQLAESEKKYRSIFENASEGIFRADAEGRIIDINPAFYRMAGCRSRDECLGWMSEPVSSERDDPDEFQALLREQQPVTGKEMRIRRKDGGRFWGSVSAACVQDGHEHRTVYEGMVLDITAERNRRSEEEAIAEERRRIAREIHDGIAQDLAFIRLRTSKWRRMIESEPERLHGEFDLLRDLLGKNIQEVRRSIFALRPAALEELGFFPALERFVDDFREQMEIQLLFTVSGDGDGVPTSLELAIFRILQESLNNVAKHAAADTAWVSLDILPYEIRLSIADNGCGVLSGAGDDGAHYGVRQMRERVHHFGGTFYMTRRDGGGTQVQAVFPIQKGEMT